MCAKARPPGQSRHGFSQVYKLQIMEIDINNSLVRSLEQKRTAVKELGVIGLLWCLQDMAIEIGERVKEGQSIKLHITLQTLCEQLNRSRPTIIKDLHYLDAHGWIELDMSRGGQYNSQITLGRCVNNTVCWMQGWLVAPEVKEVPEVSEVSDTNGKQCFMVNGKENFTDVAQKRKVSQDYIESMNDDNSVLDNAAKFAFGRGRQRPK